MNAVRPAPVLPKQNKSPARQSQTPEIAAGDQSPYLQTRRRRLKVLQGMMNAVRPAPVLPKAKQIPSQTKSTPGDRRRRSIPVGVPHLGKIAAGGQSPSVSPHPGKTAALEPSPHHEQNQETFFRNCFISPRRRFDSTKRRLVALERFALRRRSLETSARWD